MDENGSGKDWSYAKMMKCLITKRATTPTRIPRPTTMARKTQKANLGSMLVSRRVERGEKEMMVRARKEPAMKPIAKTPGEDEFIKE